ncbi:MAG: NTP transferase domain-containing protein [Anaerolineales bacterium]
MGEKKQRHGSTVAGVILAAGDSERFPEPKQLLHWKGKALVWHAVRAALEGGLEPVVVVTGADADGIGRRGGGSRRAQADRFVVYRVGRLGRFSFAGHR